MENPRGHYVEVLRGKHDSTNGGLSNRFNDFVLVDEQRPIDTLPFSPDDKTPGLRVVRRWAGSANEYVHAEPLEPLPEGHVGWMFGGHFVYSSDSRFRQNVNAYPIPLHDRSETQEQYDYLSR